jgi:predicted Zn finger-like uncharacterized protein
VKVTCQSCGARYGIADAKIRGRRAKVRCKSCKAVFVVDGTALDPDADTAGMRESMAPSMSLPPPEPDAGVYDVPSGSEIASAPVASDPSSAEAGEPAADAVMWSVSVTDNDERTLTTDELLAGLAAGELGEEPYIWRDGMGDWAPPAQVPEIAALLDGSEAPVPPVPVGTDSDPSEPFASAAPEDAPADDGTPAPFAAPPEQGEYAPEPAPEPAPEAETNANYIPVADANPTPAPFQTNTDYAPVAPAQSDSSPEPASAPAPMFPGSVDLFAGVDRAGSEEDVIASVPPPPPHLPTTKTGERNETSVLFTLDALRAGGAGAKPAPPPVAAAPAPNLADLVSASHGAFTEEADMATFAAPIVQDLPPPTATSSGGQPQEPKSKKVLFLAAAAAVVIFAGVGFAVASGGGDDDDGKSADTTATATAKTDDAAAKTADQAGEKPDTKPSDTKPASGQEPAAVPAPADGEAPTDAAATAPLADAATAEPADKAAPKAAVAPKKKAPPRKKKVVKKKPTPKKAPQKSLTGQKPPFNMSAAKKALSSAAKRAKGCKRSGGPTGKVKVSVTFSNSGRTTSSKVVAGPVRGTLIGGCVATAFRKTKVPAFSGPRKTIPVSFRLK